MRVERYLKSMLLFIVTLSLNLLAQTPTIHITGTVIDKETNSPLMYATVYFAEGNEGTSTDQDGNFSLNLNAKIATGSVLRISLIGYKSQAVQIENAPLKVKLIPDVKLLGDVVVEKQRYRRRNNPAVELISNVIDHKKQNSPTSIPYLKNEKYEKVQFAINKITDDFQKSFIFKHFQFVFENIDSLNGEQVLPVFLKESIYATELRESQSVSDEKLIAHKSVTFAGFDRRSIDENLKYLYQDINIYNNNIPLLSTQFLSPIANNATLFYRYYIQDTVKIENQNFIKMYFAPRNKEDLLFQGNMYISMDSSFAIRKLELTTSKSVNVNWVSDIKVVQNFDRYDNRWLIQSENISMKFGLSKNSRGIIGQKAVFYSKFKFDDTPNDTIEPTKAISQYNDEQLKLSETYLENNRAQQLSKSEKGVYLTMDSIRKVPSFKRLLDVASVLMFGYKEMGKYEIGPINTFYMYNPVEGFRLRVGGRTTNAFSKKINIETYGAYGFFDKKWKYYLGGSWSLSDRGLQQFPVKVVKLSYQNDTQLPGQLMQFLMEDNFLLSIKRGVNDKLFYNKTLKLEHINEFENHFTYTLGYKFTKMTPGGSLFFNYSDYDALTNDVPYLNVSEFSVSLRYAPNESFFQGKTFRVQNYNRFPIFELRYAAGNKLWLNDYNYHSLRLNVRKRVYLSLLGYSDVVLEGGRIFGKVPYPLLHLPQANQSYSYQIESFNLMNFLEFATDKYASLLIDHSFNGFIFSKIPGINKMNLREHVTCKMYYGSLSAINNPNESSDVFKLPTSTNDNLSTGSMGTTPYIEGSVGIANLFKIFRIDLVKRFTYLDNPNVSEWGVRMRFRLDF